MPTVGFQALAALVVLLPGLISSAIVSGLCVREKKSEFDKVIDALLHTFVVIVCYAVVIGRIPLECMHFPNKRNNLHHRGHSGTFSCIARYIRRLESDLFALDNNDLVFKLLRFVRITTRTARSTVWHDVFSTYGPAGYVQVLLNDGNSILGYLRKYSEKPSESSLFIEDACWVDQDGNTVSIDGPGILLTKNSGITSVMFVRASQAEQSEANTFTATSGT